MSTTGRWTDAEHTAFEDGLKSFGTNWRRIQTLVPTRTLVQIRTHAQKYFLKHGTPGPGTGHMKGLASQAERGQNEDADDGMGDVDGSADGGSNVDDSELTIRPLATIRHVALEPMHPTQPLGLQLGWDSAHGQTVITGFAASPSEGSAGASRDSASDSAGSTSASPSELVRAGDVILGVSGVCTFNMDPAAVLAAIASARLVVPDGLLVLHLSDTAIDSDVVQEASIQIASAAAQLLGATSYVEACQLAVSQAILHPAIQALTSGHMQR